MITLIETTDRSLLESLLLGLQAENIEYQVLESGGSLPFVPTTVRVAEANLTAAKEVLATLR